MFRNNPYENRTSESSGFSVEFIMIAGYHIDNLLSIIHHPLLPSGRNYRGITHPETQADHFDHTKKDFCIAEVSLRINNIYENERGHRFKRSVLIQKAFRSTFFIFRESKPSFRPGSDYPKMRMAQPRLGRSSSFA